MPGIGRMRCCAAVGGTDGISLDDGMFGMDRMRCGGTQGISDDGIPVIGCMRFGGTGGISLDGIFGMDRMRCWGMGTLCISPEEVGCGMGSCDE